MLRKILIGAGASLVIGCVGGCSTVRALFAERAEPAPAPTEAVAATAPAPYRSTSGPMGLVHCRSVVVTLGDGCWRRNDVHTLYPAASPGGVDTASAAYATPVSASVRKK